MTDRFTATLDMTRFREGLRRMDRAARGETLKKAALAGGLVIETYAKINVNDIFSSKATGGAGLGGSITTEVTKASDTAVEVSTGPTVVYGRIQELGGIIKPVLAKMLHWINDAGEDVFAHVVHIPARPYLRPAVDEHQEEIIMAVAAVLSRAIGEVGPIQLPGNTPVFVKNPKPVRSPKPQSPITSWGNDEFKGRLDP